MDLNQFKDRTIIPEMLPQDEPMEEEVVEDSTTPILETMLVNQAEKAEEANQLLEHILTKLDDNSDKTIDEYQLQKTAEVVDELKVLNKNQESSTKAIVEREPNKIIIGGGSKVVAVKGVKGDKGDKGERGEKGDKGEKGEPGKNGKDGYTPIRGVDYSDGIDGKTPVKGVDYFDGKPGPKGMRGPEGVPGDRGEKGDKGDPGKDAELDLEKLREELNSKMVYDKIIGAPQFRGGSISRATEFKELTDVPQSYVGEAGKFLKVKATENGLEYGSGDGIGDVVGPAGATADNIATYSGATGKIIKDGGAKISDLLTTSSAASTYAKLDGTNGPFTENVSVGTNIAGKNISSFATLGADITPGFTAAAWTLGTGWDATNAGDTMLSKNVDGTGTATPSGAGATPVVGVTYKVTITVGAVSVASGFTWTYGGVGGIPITAAGTYTQYFTAATTGKLIFTPTPTATRFTITAISILPKTTATGDAVVEGDIYLGGTLKKPNGTVIARITPTGGVTFTSTSTTALTGPLAITGTFTGATTGTFTDTITVTRTAQAMGTAAGSSPSYIATNTTAATAVAPIQISPGVDMRGTAWDSSSKTHNWRNFMTGIYDATTATARMIWQYGYTGVTQTLMKDRMSLGSEGTLDVFGTTYASESLTNGALTSGTSWARTGDMALASNAATYTHSAGSGTLTQAQASLAVAGVANRWYKFDYTTSTVTTGATAYIDTTFASKRIYLNLVAGTYSVYFKAAAAPTDFKITVTSTAGAFTIDTLSLVQITSGDIIANGKFTGGGATGLKIDGAGAAVFDSTLSASNLSGTNTGDGSGHTGLVPYTGATGDVNLGANGILTNKVTLATGVYMEYNAGTTSIDFIIT